MSGQKLGKNRYGTGPSRAPSRCRLLGRAFRSAVVVLALVSVGWSPAAPPAGASEVPGKAAGPGRAPSGYAGQAKRLTPVRLTSPSRQSRRPAP